MATRKGPLESSLKKKVLAALRARGGWWRVKTGYAPYEESGTPDIFGCYKGRFIAFELKRPRAKRGATIEQALVIDNLAATGALAFVIERLDQALNVIGAVDRQERA